MSDLGDICETIRSAKGPLRITGGGSRRYPYASLEGLEELNLADYSGIIDYHPEELVVRVKSGTLLADLSATLAEQGQMLASEPPAHGNTSTIGGAVAAGLSGSRRPYAGSTRDYVLGVGLILHDGEYAEFGGQVMKNVAGYDVARLVCGSFGVLGPIADISLKVLPLPEVETTTILNMPSDEAVNLVRQLQRRVSGLSASAYLEGDLYLRFSGREKSVQQSIKDIGGVEGENDFWADLDSQQLPIFENAEIWRLSTDPAEVFADDFALMDWGFAQRWVINPEHEPRSGYQGDGHWTYVSSASPGSEADVFHPLPDAQLALMRSLKKAFDPDGLFNPDRMYTGV